MRDSRTIFLICALAVVIAVLATGALDRRPDLADPAEIAKLPGHELRDVEIERLVRAAFLEARSAHIKSEAARSITVTDPAVLRQLADLFAIGRDEEQLPMYRHPGLEYTVITFDGPYTPELFFTGPKDVMLRPENDKGHWPRFSVRTKFARMLASLLHLR